MKKPEPKPVSVAPNPAAAPAEGSGIDAMAARWLARRDAGLTPLEWEELRSWLAAASGHAAAFARADAGRNEFDWPLHAGAIDDLLTGLEVRARRRRRRRGAVAASLTLVLLTGLMWPWPRTSPPMVENPSSAKIVAVQPQRQILSDGSVIDLRIGAEIAVDYRGQARLVTLRRGTAYFQVAKNPERPFVVRALERTVRAVGTAFTVELGAREMTVLVAEGTVAVGGQTPDPGPPSGATSGAAVGPTSPPALVGAGNLIVLDVSAGSARPPEVHAVSAAEIERLLAWRVPRLEFSGVALREVVAMFNRHNRVQIKVLDPSLAGLKLSGSLRADKVNALVQMLESDYRLKAERRDAEIILRR